MARAPFIKWSAVWPQVKALLEDGYSAPEVEKETGIKASSINGYCSRIQYKIKRTNKDKAKYTPHEIDLMVVLRLIGLKHQEIADKFDCTYHDVSRLTAKKFRMAKLREHGHSVDEIATKFNADPLDVLKATSNIMEILEDEKRQMSAQRVLPPNTPQVVA